MVSMSLMRGQSMAGAGRLEIASPPAVSLTPTQPTKPDRPPMSRRFLPRRRQGGPQKKSLGGMAEAHDKRPAEAPSGGRRRGRSLGNIWHDGEALVCYLRGTQIPRLAIDLYTLPSEALMDQATKAMVLAELEEARREQELVEKELSETQTGLTDSRKLLSEGQGQLAEVWERIEDSEEQLRGSRTKIRQMETKLLKIARVKDQFRAELPREAVEDYKKSLGFKMGLSGRGECRCIQLSVGVGSASGPTPRIGDRIGPLYPTS
ncbi:hypothetical protein BHE74_00010130 [Ensete ventricosum]|nr:hypothetical protein BHE74_00010130 [Ensete ventricosum]